MSNVLVERTTLDSLAESIALKSDENVPMTLSEMIEAVDGITLPQGEINITTNGTVNVAQYESANVNVQSGEPSLQTKTVSYTPTESQQTATVTADSGYDGLDEVDVTVGAISSTYVGSGITRRSSTNLTASGATVTAPAGYYENAATKTVASGTEGTPTATKGTVSNHAISVTPSVTNTAGYIAGGTKTGTAVTVTASELASGNKSITQNGTGIDVVGYSTVSVSVPSGSPTLQTKAVSYTPTASQQTDTITADSGYDGLDEVDVTVNAIPAGSKGMPNVTITKNDGVYRRVVTYPSATGYFTRSDLGEDSYMTLQNEVVTPTESEQVIEPTSTSYYLNSVTVGAISSTYVGSGIDRNDSSDLTFTVNALGATVGVPSGYYGSSASKTIPIASAPTGTISVSNTGLIEVSIDISQSGYSDAGSTTARQQMNTQSATTITPTESAQTAVASNVYTTGAVTVGAIPSDYVGSGITRRSASDLSASGQYVSVPAGYYEEASIKGVSTMTLPTTASTTQATGSTTLATIDRSTVDRYINISTGYNTTKANYKISAVPNGTVTAPASISGTSATVSTGTNTLTLTKTVSVTPSVSTAGYVSSGTAGNSSVSLTASVTTKAAATYNTSTTDQTISASQYLTGAQTIKAVVVSGLSADKILSGTTVTVGDANDADRIASVSGSVVISHYYTGSSAPASSLGSNGDIYLKTS